MIKRINLIKGIGKYQDFSGNDKELSKFTIIEGQNCDGKTTLGDIFKSLKGEDIDLSKRETVSDKKITQIVNMSIFNDENKKENIYIYNEGKWGKNYKNIQIFDTEFMNKNVINGLILDKENKKNLTNFIIGEESVEYGIQVQDIEKEIDDVKTKLNLFKNKHFENMNESEIDEFIKYKFEENIESIKENLKNKTIELKNLNQLKENITNISSIKDKEKIKYDFTSLIDDMDSIAEILNRDITGVVGDITEEFNLLKNRNNTQKNGKWIKEGYDILKEKNNNSCPFCSQDMTNTQAIQIYKQYFSEAVSNLYEDIEKYYYVGKKNVNTNLITKIIHQNSNENSNNLKILNTVEFEKYRNEMIENEKNIILQLEKLNETFIDNFYKMAKIKLDEKRKSINMKIDINDEIEKVKIAIELEQKTIEDYNLKIDIINNYVLDKKENLDQELTKIKDDIIKIEVEINKLNLMRSRLEKETVCSEYKGLKEGLKKLEKDRKGKRKELQEAREEYVSKYFEKTNEYFKKLSSRDFEIEKNINNSLKTADNSSTYELNIKFRGVDVKNDDIKYYMSESDKRALALSVFLAKIDKMSEDEKKKQIIIMDDPFTSFDDNRALSSNIILRELLKDVKQIIIITHYTQYIKKFCLKNYNLDELKLYKIMHRNNKSVFKDMKVEDYVESDYIKSVKDIVRYIDYENDDILLEKLRVILEKYVYQTYYITLYKDKISGISNQLNHLKSLKILTEKRFNELELVRESTNSEHHDTFSEYSDEEKRKFCDDILSKIFEGEK